jgi:hypothetical protein
MEVLTNRIRTPPKSPKTSRDFKIFFNNNNQNKYSTTIQKEEDKCKIHLAEIFTLTKKVDKLNSELDEKIKSESLLNKNIKELEKTLNEKINQQLIENNEQKCTIENQLQKIEILEKTHDFNELVSYYENQIEEMQNKNINYIKMLTQITNKISSSVNNKDDVWRNLIKKLENKIIELESQIFDNKKKERKIFSRQKFFEKYCFKAEEKIEEISKISKKFYDQESTVLDLKAELEKLKIDNKTKNNEVDSLNKELNALKKDNEKIKLFVNKIKPILKIDWEEIKKTNEENFEMLVKNSKSDEYNYNSKNIIILLENLNNFLETILEETLSNKLSQNIQLTQITQIVEDVKSYIIMLLKKIQLMTINQYHIINTCCDLNDKIMNFVKNNKVNIDFLAIFKDIRNSCSKLLFDYNPK